MQKLKNEQKLRNPTANPITKLLIKKRQIKQVNLAY